MKRHQNGKTVGNSTLQVQTPSGASVRAAALKSGMPERKRTLYFDVLRVMATAIVMLLHVSAKKWISTAPDSLAWQAMNVGDSISRWGVPVFTMISGALFLGRRDPVKDIYRKNILKIAVTFLFWSIAYALYEYWRNPDTGTLIENLLRGHYHMWYLLMIIGLYMIVPFLRRILQDIQLTKYFMALAFVFAFLIPQALAVLSLFNVDLSKLLVDVVEKFHMQFVMGFPFYYILGFLLHRYRLTAWQQRAVTAGGIVSFVLTIVLSAAASLYKKEPVKIFYGNFTVNIMLEGIFVFVLIRRLFYRREPGERVQAVITGLSKLSLGAFLVHCFYLEELDTRFGIHAGVGNPFVTIPAIWLSAVVLSFLASWILHRIPVVNRWVL